MKVPFLDIKAQYESIKEEINDAIQQVLDSCAFAGGPFVEKFEKNFAKYCQSKYCVGVGSGTEALWLALLALGIGPTDEVITVPNSFIATAEAISFCGATPVFVDIDEQTYTMNHHKIEAAITPKTKAIIPVHLFGQMADMDPIVQIAEAHDLFVIEDACQAHCAEYKGRLAGTIGDLGCFSFYPGKNLGAYGEAGAVVTNNEDLAEMIFVLRDHGQSQKYHHEVIGWNSRMDGFQGAVLNVKLKYLNNWNDSRRKIAELYNVFLRNFSFLIEPYEAPYSKHVYHVYAIRVPNRDHFIASLAAKGIFCGIHYPIPMHLQNAYQSLGLPVESYPVAELCASQFVSLPIFPEMKKEQVEYVIEAITFLS
jgi:dTDP-4-amino-4,6-dideoxygalactose transaminase